MLNKRDDASEAFVELMTRYQGRLFGYALSLTADHEAANDLLQETNVVLWENWKEFKLGTNFKAWSFRIAHFQFMAQRQRRLRDRLTFGDNLVAKIAVEARDLDDTYERRVSYLESCLKQLKPRWRKILKMRYSEGLAVQRLANHIGLSANATSQLLFRARQSLNDCVKTQVRQGGNEMSTNLPSEELDRLLSRMTETRLGPEEKTATSRAHRNRQRTSTTLSRILSNALDLV